MPAHASRSMGTWVASGVAAVFGVATVVSGGGVIFGPEAARSAAGAYVPFVVWFNFLAGFAYIAAGTGLFLGRAWATRLSVAIAGATLAVGLAFTVHALSGGAFEMRTVGALALRSLVWIAIAAYALRRSGPAAPSGTAAAAR